MGSIEAGLPFSARPSEIKANFRVTSAGTESFESRMQMLLMALLINHEVEARWTNFSGYRNRKMKIQMGFLHSQNFSCLI